MRTEAKDSTGQGGISRSLEPAFKYRRLANFTGEGDLRNGQWWPFQLTAVRDGAHGETEAGISGSNGVATSIILNSSKSRYANVDLGSFPTLFLLLTTTKTNLFLQETRSCTVEPRGRERERHPTIPPCCWRVSGEKPQSDSSGGQSCRRRTYIGPSRGSVMMACTKL
jgi:hypothetical protein